MGVQALQRVIKSAQQGLQKQCSEERHKGPHRVYVYVVLPVIVPLPSLLVEESLLAETADKSVAAGPSNLGLLPL